jgi:hypothetical protein
MRAQRVTRQEIERRLWPHQAKIAFAARCPRIVWEVLAPRLWRGAPPDVEQALRDAERCGAQDWVSGPEKEDLHKRSALVRAHQAAGSGGPFGAAVARAIVAALEAALAEDVGVMPTAGSSPDRQAAGHAHAAYAEALRASQLGSYREPYLARTRKDFEALAERMKDPNNPSDAIPSEFFES